MAAEQQIRAQNAQQGRPSWTALFCCLSICWVVLDFALKRVVESGGYVIGQHFAGPYLGLFDCVLVHNTGAAWGIFSDSTIALGVFSIIMCILILGYFLWQRKDLCALEVVGLALVFAGGIGNAIDRFVLGYVVDYINFTFIDFPVFNIADIGVTCGIVLFLIGCLLVGPALKRRSQG